MTLVSVVVATYAPGPGLDHLVESLDAQTLRREDFEVIFVDDGSPDDTVERLRRICSTRPNFRVEEIENSGWASRPRNVGTDLAVGEYVLYMDHDDQLYPDALRAAYEFARANGADVLNGKEARTHDPGWALDTYRGDRAQDAGREDAHPLVPMNPHKLYRRQLLLEHGIRFPEGRRVLWEDIFFNVQVAAHAKTISTLSSTPFYHWVQTTGSGSTTFKRSDPAWWDHLERVLEAIETELGHDTLQSAQLRRHQYRSRILSSFSPAFLARPQAERDLIERRARSLQARFMRADDDEALDRGALATARALRSESSELLALVASTTGTDRFGTAQLASLEWRDGRLVIAAASTTVDRLPGGGTFARDGDDVLAVAPEVVDELGTTTEFDVANELHATTGAFVIRGRSSRLAWNSGGRVTSRSLIPVDSSSRSRFVLATEGDIDVRSAAGGNRLDREVWDVFLRVDRVGRIQHPRVRATIPAMPAFVDGCPMTAYTTRDGYLSVDLGDEVASMFDGCEPDGVVSTSRTDAACTVELSLPGVHTSGTERGNGSIELSYRRAGARSRVIGAIRRMLRREHPPVRFPVVYAPSGDTGVTASLTLPPQPGRYTWQPSDRSAGLQSWVLVVDAAGASIAARTAEAGRSAAATESGAATPL